MPYGITQCYLPPGRGDIPALIDCMRQGLCSGTVSVRRSVPAIGRCSRVRTAGLLPWARRSGDIDRLLRPPCAGAATARRSAANASSVSLSAERAVS